MPPRPLELLRRPAMMGPAVIKPGAGAKAWAGRTVIPSGSSAVTVSTQMVTSNCLWRLAELPSSTGVSSGGHVVVNSVVQGVSFALARANAVAAGWDLTASWEIVRVS